MGLLDDAYAQYNAQPAWVQTTFRVALVVLVGALVLSLMKRYADSVLRRVPRMDRTVRSFVHRLISAGGWLLILVTALATGGVNVSALLGGLAIGGFVIGFALKDTLGNLAAGLMLLFYRPFNVGDYVTVGSSEGEVTGLGMALTTLLTADGRIISMPNGSVFGGEIVNHTRMDRRRADVVVGIDYEDDIDTAVKAILEAVKADPRVLAEPAPGVRITTLGDSSVGLQVRPWVRTTDFWQAKADMNAIVKRAVEAAGCSIPFPQRVVSQRTIEA